MKWAEIHPSPDRYDFSAADALVAFARRHGMAVRGHNLVWAINNPGWLEHGTWTRDELLGILHAHIRAVVGRYRGQIAQWDVVNEVVDGRGELRDSIWLRRIGPEYIDLAFEWAHQADPGALLFDNEDASGDGRSVKQRGILRLVQSLRQRGVPISGVGIETHTGLYRHLGAHVSSFMRALNSVGVAAAITEMDVALPESPSQTDLDKQARIYAEVLDACLRARNCHTFVTWGFTDRYSWIPAAEPGLGHALPFDENYRPKPAFKTLLHRLSSG
jgi:endo-1,4-beta-xylanase